MNRLLSSNVVYKMIRYNCINNKNNISSPEEYNFHVATFVTSNVTTNSHQPHHLNQIYTKSFSGLPLVKPTNFYFKKTNKNNVDIRLS